MWQGSAGDRRPYADQTGFEEIGARVATRWKRFLEARFLARNNFRNACRELAMREGGKGA